MSGEELTTSEVAARLGRPERTVRLWCKQGRFVGARSVSTPRGDYWVIPQSALDTFEEPRAGRPPTARGSIDLQAQTTRALPKSIQRAAEERMGSKRKGGKT